MKKTILAVLTLVMLAVCLTGCQKSPVADTGNLDNYLASIKEKSDAIRTSLEQEELTQADMNQRSEELRALWEGALNRLLEEAKKALPQAEQEQLAAEQSAWTADTETAIEAAGKEFEGGSMYALIVNSEAARLTEERVSQLFELLK